MSYIENPKMAGSGILACIPQAGECLHQCIDCFFNGGRSYLEPLAEHTPNIPPYHTTRGRVVRMNDGNDSNVSRETVRRTASQYQHYFYNTAVPHDLEGFGAPVVFTVNGRDFIDQAFTRLDPIPKNLMYVRVLVNTWNMESIVIPAVDYYTERGVPVVLTYMAYYEQPVKPGHEIYYEFKKRTLNSYHVIKEAERIFIEALFADNPLVYTCGWKGTHDCKRCGNCLREYFATQERLRGWS